MLRCRGAGAAAPRQLPARSLDVDTGQSGRQVGCSVICCQPRHQGLVSSLAWEAHSGPMQLFSTCRRTSSSSSRHRAFLQMTTPVWWSWVSALQSGPPRLTGPCAWSRVQALRPARSQVRLHLVSSTPMSQLSCKCFGLHSGRECAETPQRSLAMLGTSISIGDHVCYAMLSCRRLTA